MKKRVLFILLLTLYGNVRAQETVIGKLIDSYTELGVPYAQVVNQKTKGYTMSSESGLFQIEGSLTDTIKISCLGYNAKKCVLKELRNNQEFRLEPSKQYLRELAVVASQQENVGVQQIDKLSLKLAPLNSAQDLLTTVSGLFIAQHAGGGKSEQIFLRGFDNDHGTDFGVFIDDIPINLSSHAHGQGYADMHFIIPELIQDADYYKGPYEMKNGNFVVSGAARYKTKNGLDKNTVKLDVGQFGFTRGLVMLNLTPNNNFFKKKNNERAYIAVEGTLNKGFFDAPQNFHKISAFAKYNTNISKNTFLSFTSSYFTSAWDASGQIPLRAVNDKTISWFGAIDDTEGGNTARFNSSLKFSTRLKKNQKITNQVYYCNNQYQLFSNFTFFLNDTINGDMIDQREVRNIAGYTFEYNREDKIKASILKSTFSFGLRSDINHSKLLSAVKRETLSTINDNKLNEHNFWAYIKENWRFNDKWLLQFGSRLDYFIFNIEDQQVANSGVRSRNAYILSPKLSLFYNPTKSVQLFAKAGSGYHSNYTHAAVDERDVHPLPRALSADLGTEIKIGKRVITSVAFWTTQSDAEYIFVADAGEFENNGRSLRAGVDVSIKAEPINNLWINFDGNYSKGKLLDETEGANSIPSAPRFTSTASIVYKLKQFDFYVGGRYMAERPLTEDESVIADAYFLLDASVTYGLKKFKFNVSAQNILNTKWMEAVFYDASRLQNEVAPQDDFHFTPGTPLFFKGSISYSF